MFSVSQELQGLKGPKESNKNIRCLPHEPAHFTPALTLLSRVKMAPVIDGESKLKTPFVYRGDAWLQGVVLKGGNGVKHGKCSSVQPCLGC